MNSPSIIQQEVTNAKAYLVFAHGAGADKSSAFLEQVSEQLNQRQFNVLRFNFNYMDKRLADGKRYPPERMPKLVDCFNQVLASLETSLPVFLIGKSMGSRVAATIANQPEQRFRGVICLGYPFHPQKQPEKLRLEPLQQSLKPILVVQGTRDALGNQQEISEYDLPSSVQVEFLADGDHDLKPRKKSGYSHEQHLSSALDKIEAFIDEWR
ncbi:alpha/beta family hydrolase [Thalassotalea sp. G2M2-11]|uniref:alpha/beta family hydrolase n=1 Tax=Thalassotalea sp. G2M2-11 TaxID=2787627 RepID=UPI0019D04875|nr:alpha/beta family hydrolase [Thalassotalea sp. G2M2-11]